MSLGADLPDCSSATLVSLLEAAAKTDGNINILKCGSTELTWKMSYAGLLAVAKRNARILGVTPPSRRRVVLVHFDGHDANIVWFWAVVLAGHIPAMSMPFPAISSQRQRYIRHLNELLQSPICVTSQTMVHRYPEMRELINMHAVENLKPIQSGELHFDDFGPGPSPEEPAFLLLTICDSGNAKAVVLTAYQLLSAISGKVEALQSQQTQHSFLNWVDLSHVAALVEIHLHALILGKDQIHVPAADVILDPLLLLRLIDKHRVSYTIGNKFFLELLDCHLAAADPSNPVFKVDLSCLKSIMSGREANATDVSVGLTRRLQRLKAPRNVICAGYGLAESCAGITYHTFDPEYEAREKPVFASLGKPISKAQMRIITEGGELAAPYKLGDVEISGPAVFKEYYNDKEATKRAFPNKGWFRPGDWGFLDNEGIFNLAGPLQESLSVNGVNFTPHQIEIALEEAHISGTCPGYFVVFSHHHLGDATEGYCVIYGPSGCVAQDETVEWVARAAGIATGMRPIFVVPLHLSILERAHLEQWPRTPLETLFRAGAFDRSKVYSTRPLTFFRKTEWKPPMTRTQRTVCRVLCEMLELPSSLVSIDQTIFELGLTSSSLFRLEKRLRNMPEIPTKCSVRILLANPVIEAISDALDNASTHRYNPVSRLQAQGRKTPLWLVHGATGNSLAFLPLSRVVMDRPLFALSARGLRPGEVPFDSIEEMVDTYVAHIKETQPTGPYAIMGCSLGTTIAFEVSKRLEAGDAVVAFCGALDSPPHIRELSEAVRWVDAAVFATFFLELITQDTVQRLRWELANKTRLEIISRLIDECIPEKRAAIQVSHVHLAAITNVTARFCEMAARYEPSGSVAKVDVFYSCPLGHIEQGRESTVKRHLLKWADFSREEVNFVECEGEHADMINSKFVVGFEKRLRRVLAARGI